MSLVIGILFGLILVMIALLVLEVLSVDVIGLLVMVSLMFLGVFFPGSFVNPQEGVSGMSNPATVTVLSLMILSIGLENTGVVQQLGSWLKPLLLAREWLGLLLLMVVVGFFSTFIATTAVVIVFLRMLVDMSERENIALPRYLIPLSFAGILGGSCTLLGTTTNLLVSGVARTYDIAPIGIFEFSAVGALFFVAAVGYMLLIGRHLLPKRPKHSEKLLKKYELEGYLAEIVVGPDSPIIGKKRSEINFFQDHQIEIVDIRRANQPTFLHQRNATLLADDILLVKGRAADIATLISQKGIEVSLKNKAVGTQRFTEMDVILCEVMILPNSSLIGGSVGRLSQKLDYQAVPLAVRRNRSANQFRKLFGFETDRVRLKAGDSILLETDKESFADLRYSRDLVILQELATPSSRSHKAPIAIGIMVLVVVVAALGWLPIMVSALAGCVAMLLTRCLNFQQAYERVDWSVFFLLSGMIPLGIAMENSGAGEYLANLFTTYLSNLSPRLLVGVLFGTTALLSAFISNNATAILITPVAISIAYSLQMDPRPLLFTVMFGANTSYMTPVGYQTNTLVYGPGGYRFSDFFKVGGLLTLLILALAMILIPIFYF